MAQEISIEIQIEYSLRLWAQRAHEVTVQEEVINAMTSEIEGMLLSMPSMPSVEVVEIEVEQAHSNAHAWRLVAIAVLGCVAIVGAFALGIF
jgi:hypothetical protein